MVETRRGISLQEGEWGSDKIGEKKETKRQALSSTGREEPQRAELRNKTTGATATPSKHMWRKCKEHRKSDETTTMRPRVS
jgi:hypothetical protein